MIPKVIHYCWFGGNKKSELIEKCIASWREHCPDYEIVEWNESNFDVGCLPYTKAAYADKKWAFVSDYARLAIIYKWGGFTLILMSCYTNRWMTYWGTIAGWHRMMFDILPLDLALEP